MRKWVAVILLILLVAIICVWPITQKTNITISATFDNTVLQIIHLENWKNWYPEIKKAYNNDSTNYSFKKDSSQKIYTITASSKKFIVHVLSPTSYQVNEVSGNWTDIFAFSVLPGNDKMQISLVKKDPLLFVLLNKNKSGENALNGLKDYLEDPKSFYGFEIKRSTIRDSVIASSNFKIKNTDIFSQIHEGYQNLQQYIKTNGLEVADHPSVSYNSISGDSLQITIGIPVNKPGPPAKNIECLLLPAKGNVLVGNYEGKFSDRKKIYLAMSKYVTDHTFAPVAESFERYLNDSIPSSDSSIIKIELNYPIY
jgi:effector-binding domain-containing protein